jgi:hypothetical protein
MTTPDELQSAPPCDLVAFESAAGNEKPLMSDVRAATAAAAASETNARAASVAMLDRLVDAATVVSASPAATTTTVSTAREMTPTKRSSTDAPAALESTKSDTSAALDVTPDAAHARGGAPAAKMTLLGVAPAERIATAAHTRASSPATERSSAEQLPNDTVRFASIAALTLRVMVTETASSGIRVAARDGRGDCETSERVATAVADGAGTATVGVDADVADAAEDAAAVIDDVVPVGERDEVGVDVDDKARLDVGDLVAVACDDAVALADAPRETEGVGVQLNVELGELVSDGGGAPDDDGDAPFVRLLVGVLLSERDVELVEDAV